MVGMVERVPASRRRTQKLRPIVGSYTVSRRELFRWNNLFSFFMGVPAAELLIELSHSDALYSYGKWFYVKGCVT